MSEQNVGGSGHNAGPSALSRLIGVGAERFAEEFWGREALLTPAADLDRPPTELLTGEAVDELVSERGLRTPFLRVAKAGNTLPEQQFTAPGGVGAGVADQVSDDKLVRLFADGSTLVLQGLHRMWPPVIAFAQQLAAELGHPVQANAYITPPQNQGFSNHYDVHDVFVIQLEGEKRWQIHRPVHEAPLRDQPWTDRRAAVERRAQEEPLIDAVLRPGDVLYLPRGFLHAATALGGVSTHLTIGVHTWTRHALAERLMQQALRTLADDPELRRSLPMQVDFADGPALRSETEPVRQALLAALGRLDLDALSTTMAQQNRATQRAAPIGPLRQLRDADRLTAESTVELRGHLAAVVEQRGGRSWIRSRSADFVLAEDEVAPVKTLLAAGTARADDLGVDLARRLLRAGLATLR